MRHLENAFRFTFKNFILTLPMLIAAAIPALIMGVGSMGFLLNFGNFQRIIEDMSSGRNFNFGPDFFTSLYGPTMLVSMAIAGLLSLVFAILVQPATYGLINKKYETGSATLSDITSSMSKFIGRYVLYILLNLAIGIGVGLIMTIIIVVGTIIIASGATAVGVLFMVLLILASIVGLVALYTYMSLWFPSVCVEDSDIITGLKNSFKYVRGSFWPIFGIKLLVTLCASIAGGILGGIIGLIPVIGSIVAPVVTALGEFILIVFFFEIYREKTGRYTIPEAPQQFNGGFPNGGPQ